MNDNLKALFEGVELSEETKTKITAILESEVDERVATKTQELTEQYEQAANDYQAYIVEEYKELSTKYIQEEVLPNLTKYADFAVAEFIKENSSKFEASAKVQIAESFLKGITTLAESFNVKLPEGADQTNQVEDKLNKMTERLDAQLTENKKLQEQVDSFKKEKIVAPVMKDLTESQKEKFTKVVEKVKFVNEAQFTEAVQELYESYFPAADDNKNKIDESIKPSKPVQLTETKQDQWLDAILSKV